MFFVVGRNVVAAGGRRSSRGRVEAGHLVGSHTWSHTVTFGHAGAADVDRELDDGRRAVADAGGDGQLFRPYGAGGSIDDRLMSRRGAERLIADGCTCVLWNSVPGDWLDPAGWPTAALADVERHRGRSSSSTTSPTRRSAGSTSSSSAAPTAACRHAGRAGRVHPIRAGVPTASFDLLGVGPAPAR